VSKNLSKFSFSEWQFIGPDDKTTKCFLSTGGNRRFRPLAQGYWLPGTKDIQALFFDIVVAMMDWFIVHKKG
jgi:ABC-type cobalt transport system substrate-binding protein